MIERSWQTGNERADNIYFWESFGFKSKQILKESTDGIVKGTLFEFKNSIPNLNKVLSQALHYLSRIRNKGGIPVPTIIVLIDINKNKGYAYKANKYRNYIEKDYLLSASKDNDIILSDSTNPDEDFYFDPINSKNPLNDKLKKYFDINDYQSFDIGFPNILGWANYIYSSDKTITKSQMFDILRHPEKTCVDSYINPWTGEESDFSLIMDTLNDPFHKKDLGAFYTPNIYANESLKLVRKAIKLLPDNRDYIILDRCAGTGNLEDNFTNDELSHVIVNTFEIKEWLILYNKFAGKVRGIIPPLSLVKKQYSNLVQDGDALSSNFLDTIIETEYKHNTLRDIVNDSSVSIIGLENPPYSSELARAQEGNKKNKQSYIRKLMSKNYDGDSGNAKDLINQFVWSFENTFMRDENDFYVLYGPCKYWKTAGLMKKELIDGFLANRGNFKANESAISVCLWRNLNKEQESIELRAMEVQVDDKKWYTGKSAKAINIPDNAYLSNVSTIKIKKCYRTLGNLYAKTNKASGDVPTRIVTGYDGYETHFRNYSKGVYNDNILAALEASGFGITPQDLRMTRIALYNGRGSIVRTNNYKFQLPLFAAKSYAQDKWYNKDVYYTTDDKNGEYQKDTDFLRKCSIFACISLKNHCIDFIGSDDHHYINELCFEENTFITKQLIENKELGELDFIDNKIIDEYRSLLSYAKQTTEYNNRKKYGTYQIDVEINTKYKDDTGKTIYNNEKVNTKLLELKKLIKDYYKKELIPKLFKYELLK